ncbi:MAG: oligoendopeptidase F family protein [Eubacteriales bacterium]|nr:oligoendopeptidase F family protein [Eubacteriales bacterium]
MTKPQRILACLFALILALSMSLTALAEERQTTWELTDLYADDVAVEAEITEIQTLIDQLPSFRGTLKTVEGVVAWYAFQDELLTKLNRLGCYATLKTSLNAGDSAAQTLSGRIDNLSFSATESSAFAANELFSQDAALLDELEQDERMTPYLLDFQRARKESVHLLGEEQENLLLPLTRLTYGASDLFSTLSYLELPYSEIEFPDGVTRTADENNYGLALLGGFTQEFRKSYSEAMMSAYASFRNTYAQNFQNYCTGVSENAKAHGYASALEADLATSDVEPTLYRTIIDASLTGNDLVGRYANLMKQELGLSEIYGFDMNLPIAPEPGITYTYDEACEIVLAALAPLGETYVADARKALAGGWVDAYAAQGKRTGAFSMGIRGAHPYMLLNFDGTFHAMSTLAHELGHTMNQWYADQAQETAYNANPGTIVTEVTSTLNELLLSDYMIKNAQTDAERKYYIAQEMSTLYSTFFTQAQFARFQQISMEALESGETLTADLLEQLWLENSEKYSGGEMQTLTHSGMGWARIPHFFQGYYVYQYAVAISASCDITQRITSGEEGAVESYLTYIASGDPASTAETLAIAGVDATNGDFVNNLLVRFGTLMDEYEAIEVK